MSARALRGSHQMPDIRLQPIPALTYLRRFSCFAGGVHIRVVRQHSFEHAQFLARVWSRRGRTNFQVNQRGNPDIRPARQRTFPEVGYPPPASQRTPTTLSTAPPHSIQQLLLRRRIREPTKAHIRIPTTGPLLVAPESRSRHILRTWPGLRPTSTIAEPTSR